MIQLSSRPVIIGGGLKSDCLPFVSVFILTFAS